MEGLILGTTTPNKQIGPLLVEQRRIGDEYRAVEKTKLHLLLAGTNIDPIERTEMEAGVIARTAELMRLGQRIFELDASVIVASLRAS